MEAITYPLPGNWIHRQFWRVYDRTRWRIHRHCEVETAPGCYNGSGTVFERLTQDGHQLQEPGYWTTLCFAEHAKRGTLVFIEYGEKP